MFCLMNLIMEVTSLVSTSPREMREHLRQAQVRVGAWPAGWVASWRLEVLVSPSTSCASRARALRRHPSRRPGQCQLPFRRGTQGRQRRGQWRSGEVGEGEVGEWVEQMWRMHRQGEHPGGGEEVGAR